MITMNLSEDEAILVLEALEDMGDSLRASIENRDLLPGQAMAPGKPITCSTAQILINNLRSRIQLEQITNG